MKRILLITARYAPFIGPRAHRWTSVAEYWARQGWTVHVVAPRLRGFPRIDVVNGVNIHRVGFDSLKELGYFLNRSTQGRGRVGALPRAPGLLGRLGIWLYEHVWKNLYFPDDAMLWYFPARKKALQLIDREEFDAVISVSLPFTGHLIGRAAKRRKPEMIWLADIGDPFFIQAKPLNNPRLYGRLSRRLEGEVLRSADISVVTTRAAQQKYAEVFGNESVARMRVIPPLLQPAFQQIEEHHPSEGQVNVGYFGAFYAPVRTPDALLHLLEQTFTRQPQWQDRLRIHFYGEIFPEFFERISRLPKLELHGLRPREEAQRAIRQMDILINVGNQTDYQLPSKAVEYLASGRPVVNLTYVKDDPFIAFWGENEGLFNLFVEQGRVSETGLETWLELLDNIKQYGSNSNNFTERSKPFLIENIAAMYEAALEPAQSGLGQKKTASAE